MFIRCSNNFLLERNQQIPVKDKNILAIRCSTQFGR